VPLLEVQDVTCRFGGLQALGGVTFQVDEGEVLGVIGPNGAGKSTLFGVIAGAIRASSGAVRCGGDELHRLGVHDVVRRGLAKTSQTVQVFGELSVLDNVAIGALRQARRRGAAEERALEELRFLGLAEHAERPAGDLTLAQRATLELARALATGPRVLLVDELMAGLSEMEIEAMLERLVAINREREVTLLIIEHNMRAIMKISHRVLVLDYGEVIGLGAPEAVSRDQRVIDAYLGT
jgi:branched-chain amino acid transport system ATP-binding protein